MSSRCSGGGPYPETVTAIPAPLRPLLGRTLEGLDEAILARLIDLEENQHLEFKRDLAGSKEARLEQMRDLVSFANAGGGLVLFGIDEDPGTHAASEVVGVGTEIDVVRQLEQILLERSHPVIPATVDRVLLRNGRQVVVVVISPSPLAPHAVIDGVRMSFPVRRGHGKDFLSEAQLADAYARRFAGAAAVTEQLADLHHDHEQFLSLENCGWVVVSMVPTAPAPGVVGPDAVDVGREWIREFEERRLDRSGTTRQYWNVRVGYRGLELVDGGEGTHQHGRLQVDGVGTAAAAMLVRALNTEDPATDGVLMASRSPAQITEMIIDLVDLLSSRAVDVGAGGDAHLAVSLHLADDVLMQVRPDYSQFWMGPENLGRRRGPVPVSLRSVELVPLVDDPAALLQVAHLLATDITTWFGISDLEVLDADGRITDGTTPSHTRLNRWAAHRRRA
jgi:hypothetical protein